MPALRDTFEVPSPRSNAVEQPSLERCELCEAFAVAASPTRVTVPVGGQIFGQGDPATMVYRVLKGAAVSYRLLKDGRRQVTEFHVAGDFLGLEAGLEHRTTADALGGATLACVRRADLAKLAADRVEAGAGAGRIGRLRQRSQRQEQQDQRRQCHHARSAQGSQGAGDHRHVRPAGLIRVFAQSRHCRRQKASAGRASPRSRPLRAGGRNMRTITFL